MIEPVLPPHSALETQNEKISELVPLMPENYTQTEKVVMALRVLLYQVEQGLKKLEEEIRPKPKKNTRSRKSC